MWSGLVRTQTLCPGTQNPMWVVDAQLRGQTLSWAWGDPFLCPWEHPSHPGHRLASWGPPHTLSSLRTLSLWPRALFIEKKD